MSEFSNSGLKDVAARSGFIVTPPPNSPSPSATATPSSSKGDRADTSKSPHDDARKAGKQPNANKQLPPQQQQKSERPVRDDKAKPMTTKDVAAKSGFVIKGPSAVLPSAATTTPASPSILSRLGPRVEGTTTPKAAARDKGGDDKNKTGRGSAPSGSKHDNNKPHRGGGGFSMGAGGSSKPAAGGRRKIVRAKRPTR